MLELVEADDARRLVLARHGRRSRTARGLAAERGGGGRRLPAGHGARRGAGRAPPTSPPRRWRRRARARRSSAPPTSSSPRAGETLRISLESGDPYLIRCLVSDGFGAALLPASITRRQGPPVETRPLGPPLRLPVYLLWRAGRRRSAAAEAFIEFVRERARLTVQRSPVARVAGRDPVADQASPR